MNIPIEPELRKICQKIIQKGFNIQQWSEIESDDMFQLGSFVDGFDTNEQEFCFSYFEPDKTEYWFQFNIDIAKEISHGGIPDLIGRAPPYRTKK